MHESQGGKLLGLSAADNGESVTVVGISVCNVMYMEMNNMYRRSVSSKTMSFSQEPAA